MVAVAESRIFLAPLLDAHGTNGAQVVDAHISPQCGRQVGDLRGKCGGSEQNWKQGQETHRTSGAWAG